MCARSVVPATWTAGAVPTTPRGGGGGGGLFNWSWERKARAGRGLFDLNTVNLRGGGLFIRGGGGQLTLNTELRAGGRNLI